jgi:1,2-phenylacetyl-CoA epoxidase catalytic subunit
VTSTAVRTIPELNDELHCIADFKLVLGGWYMVVVPNGRSVGDWCALCGMLQDEYGHARALYRYLATAGVPQSALDPAGDASAIRGPSLLDAPPSSWSDFVVTAFLAELMLDHQLQALATAAGPPEPRLALLAKKMLRESRFHQSYLTGWLQSLLARDADATTRAMTSPFERALDWWPTVGGGDPVHDAALRASDVDVRDGFIAAVRVEAERHGVPHLQATAGAGPWDRMTRRGDGRVGIPPQLHEAIRFRHLDLAMT